MDEDTVDLRYAARRERCRQRRDLRIDLAPGPGSVAPDETGTRPVPPRILGQHVSEIHDAAGHAQGLHRASSSAADGTRAARPLQPIYRHRPRPRKAVGRTPALRLLERERRSRDSLLLDAGLRTKAAAIVAMQIEADGAPRTPLRWLRLDLVAADMAIEDGFAVRQRDQDVHDAAAGSAIGRLAIAAFGVAEIDDVVIAAVTGQADPAHRIDRKSHRAAALALAFLVGVAHSLLHAGRIVGGIERLCVVGARSGCEQYEQENQISHWHWSSAQPRSFRKF